MASETLLIRLLDGPQKGDRICDPEVQHLLGIGWPLPDRLRYEGGYYEKVSESGLEPAPGLLRGAQYEWRPT